MKHIPYKEGMIITKPCIVKDMPMDIYHGKCTDAPNISSSGLRTIESKSPAHYWIHSPYNENRVPQKDTKALNFGRAAHALLIGGENFKQNYAVRPSRFDSWRTKDAQEWRNEQIKNGKTVLVPDDLETIKGMAEALSKHPLVRSGIMHGDIERSLFWKDKQTGVWLKARPDCLPTADGVVCDFKTAEDASPNAARRAMQERGYPMQGALIGMGMEELTGVKMTDFVLIFQEKEPPYAILVTTVDNEWIYWARRQLRRAIDTFAKCIETNEWPGYAEECVTSMPDWLRNRFVFEDQHSLIPEVPNS